MPSDPPPQADPPAGLDPSRLDIETRQPSLESLLHRVRDGGLVFGAAAEAAEPWSISAKSRLIESVLIRVPLPSFYVDAADEDRWVLIDGRRRLSALRDFVLERSFALTGLEYLTELDGQGYDDLARALKRRLGETQVTLETIKPGTPPEIRVNLFHRINPGRPAQAVREAVAGGAAVALIDRLADGDGCRAATGAGEADAAVRQAVLRFLTVFPIAHPPDVEALSDAALDRAMHALNDPSLDGMIRRHLLAERFEAAMATAAALFDGAAFRAPGDDGPGPVDPALLESWSVALARLDTKESDRLLARREEVIKAFTELLHDRDVAAAMAPGVDDPAAIRTRFSAVHDLVGQFVSA